MSADLKVFEDSKVVWSLADSASRIIAVISDNSTDGVIKTTLDELGGGTVFAVPLLYTSVTPIYSIEVDQKTGHISYKKQRNNMLAIGVFS